MKIIQDIEMLSEVKDFVSERAAPVSSELSPEEAVAELEKRLAAAKRALSLAHKLKNPDDKKKHFSLILSNMNASRAQLSRIIKQVEMFTRAEKSYEKGDGYAMTEERQPARYGPKGPHGTGYGTTDMAPPHRHNERHLSRIADLLYAAEKVGGKELAEKVFKLLPDSAKLEYNYSKWSYKDLED